MKIEDTRGKTVYRSMVAWLVAIFADPDNGFPSDIITIIDLELVPNYRERWPDLPIQDTGLFSNPNDQHVQMLGGSFLEPQRSARPDARGAVQAHRVQDVAAVAAVRRQYRQDFQ